MTVINRLRAIKYHLMDQKKEVMVGGRIEKRRKSKGEPEGGYQQCGSRSSEICSVVTGVTQD